MLNEERNWCVDNIKENWNAKMRLKENDKKYFQIKIYTKWVSINLKIVNDAHSGMKYNIFLSNLFKNYSSSLHYKSYETERMVK